MTAILEAGRISLDNNGAEISILYDSNNEILKLQNSSLRSRL